jgi:hypothetical protein
MPNWCLTRITINNENEKELEKFSNLLDEWVSKNYMKNGFGLNWLGNIVGNSGIGTIDEDGKATYRCRGTMTYSELFDNQLLIDTETAWCPMLKMWVALLEKYLPDAELIYEAEECGMGIYSTNDPLYKDKYYIDCWDIDNIETDREATVQDVRETIQELLDTTETDVDKLIDMLEDSEYADKISVHKWDFDDVSVWD